MALTLVRGPLHLFALAPRSAPLILNSELLEIETDLPEIETALSEMETVLPEIETALPKIGILSYKNNKYQPREGLIFKL